MHSPYANSPTRQALAWRRCAITSAVDCWLRRIAWTAASGNSEDDVRRLRFIKRAQALGYSLEDIAELMSLSTKRDRLRVREITRERIAEIRERVADLQSMASALENLADCCAKAPEGSACSIIAALTGEQDLDPAIADPSLVAQASVAGRRRSVRPGAEAYHRTDGVAA